MNFSIKNAGFTLIELSIVLVIIGLIVGGILVGRDLIKAAEIRAAIKEEGQFISAINTFRAKYNCLPGDCPNADQFLGSACGDSTTDVDTGCNGNGDGLVSTTMGELLKIWMHLSMTTLIQGNYTGRGSYVGGFLLPAPVGNINIPVSKLGGLGWQAVYSSNAMIGTIYNNVFSLGNIDTQNHNAPASGISRIDAYTIDSKMDDGLPITGQVGGDGTSDCDYMQNSYFTYPQAGENQETTDCALNFLW